MEKLLTLTMKENRRLEVIQEVIVKERTVARAAKELGITERHTYRVLAGVREKGALEIQHGNRGRLSPRRMPEEVAWRVIEFRLGKYVGFNDRHYTEKLEEAEDVDVGRETVRKILRSAGIGPERKARRPKHRQRRERRPRAGQMLQMDGSPHDWLEGRGPRLVLIHAVDDATNEEWGRFELEEETEGCFRLSMGVFTEKGLPESLYVDKDSIFKVNRGRTLDEQFSNKPPLTEFGRAMDELRIRVIYANSPQAKGRVERTGGTHQDRLVSELRLADAKTLEEANAVVRRYFKNYNRKFAKKAADPQEAWRPVPDGVDIKHVLCWKYKRVVKNDNTVTLDGTVLQIPPSDVRYSFAKATVEIHKLLDGTMTIHYKNNEIAKFRPKTASYKADRRTKKNKPMSEYPPKMAILPPPRTTHDYGLQHTQLTFSLGH